MPDVWSAEWKGLIQKQNSRNHGQWHTGTLGSYIPRNYFSLEKNSTKYSGINPGTSWLNDNDVTLIQAAERLLYCIVLYFIVLKGWSLLPNALRPSQHLLCSPEFRYARTWICRLNFAQRSMFQAWGSLTSLKSQTWDPQLKVPPGVLVLRIFTS